MKKTILLLLLCFVHCSKSTHPDYFGTIKPPHPADEVWINASTEPQYLDPTKVADTASSGIVLNMFVRLTQVDQKTSKIIPDLAKSWDISKNGTRYTFHLREDAMWSDGQPLTAFDVEWTWKRLSDSSTGSSYSQMADAIKNARAFREQAIQITGLNPKQDIQALEQKLKAIVPIKDVLQDQESFFALIDASDAQKKNELKKILIEKIQAGALGKNIQANVTSSEVVQVKAVDDHTLVVTLEKPVPYFLGLIDYVVFAPAPRHLIEKLKAKGKEDQWVRPENIVVSGPFTLKEEQLKQYKIFTKNPKYYEASQVRLNKVKVLMIEDSFADINAYKTGQHDWSYGGSIPVDMLETVRKYKDYHFDPKLSIYYYQLNTTRKPLDDVRVRKALSLAVDREAIVKNVTKEGQQPNRDLVPHGIPGYEGAKSSIYEPETAKKLLAQAGYPDGKGFPKLVLKFNTSDGHRRIAEAIQQMWKSVLGIQVEIHNMEWRSLLEDQNINNFDIMRFAWTGDYIDPHTFLSIFLSESKNNHTFWKSKKFDQLIQASDQILDQSKRFAYFIDAEKILADETPAVAVYSYTRSYMKKPYLRGFWPSQQDRHPWKYMWIDERWYKGVPENPNDVSDEPWTE